MKLKDALEKKKFIVTSEVQAPIDDSPEDLIKRLELVRGRVDSVAVPELEVEGIVGDSIKTCDLLKKNRFESPLDDRVLFLKGSVKFLEENKFEYFKKE